MANHLFSTGVAFSLTISIVAIEQLFKEYLSSSRQGTLFAGGFYIFCINFLKFKIIYRTWCTCFYICFNYYK